jgi:hypothetical protein
MHVDLNSLFSGLAGVVVGAVITYLLQHRLLDKQLAAAKESQDAFMAVLREFRNMLNTRLGALTSEIGNASSAAEQRSKDTK